MFLKELRGVGMAVFSKTSFDNEQPISKRFLTEHNTEETPTTFFYKQKPMLTVRRYKTVAANDTSSL